MTVEADRATIAAGITTRAQSLGQLVIANASAIYENGVFWQSDMQNTQHNLKFAALLATLLRYTSNTVTKGAYLKMVVDTVEHNLKTNATPDGLWTGGGVMPPDSVFFQGPDPQSMSQPYGATTTIPMTTDLAWIINQLPPGLIPAATRLRWLASCQANCNLLDTWPGAPVTSFYINGNYMAHLCSAYAMTALASGPGLQAKYWDMYERAYYFMLFPNLVTPGRWINYGLTITSQGGDYNWDDTVANLSENHGEIPGPAINFDPNYTLYTLDILSRQVVLTRDSRMIRVLNALSNALIPKIFDDTGSPAWTLNGVGGSRQNSLTNMATAYLPVQAMIREKQANVALLTPTKIFSLWDLLSGNGYLTTFSSTSFPTGQWPGGVTAAVANIATVRYCAELTTVSVAAT